MSVTAYKKKRISKFIVFILVLLVLLAAAITLTLRWLWNSLEQYESGTPDTAMTGYLTLVQAGDFEQVMADSDFVPDPLNADWDYQQLLQNTYRNIDLSSPDIDFRLTTTKEEDGWQQYLIFMDDSEAGELWIAPAPEESGRKWLVRGVVEGFPGYTITVPQHLRVTVSGRPLSESNATVNYIDIPIFAMLPEEIPPPRLVRYTTGETLYPQEMATSCPSGNNCVIRQEEGQGDPHRLESWEVLPAETEAEYRTLIEKVAKIYAAFITADAEFDELKPYLLPDTEFYEGVRTFYNKWYIDHESFGYENVVTDNITAWSEDTFSGYISFDYLVYQGWRVHTYPSSYHMAFIKADDQWKLIHLQVM